MLVIQQACPLIRKNQGMFKNLQDCMEEDILTCFPAIKKNKNIVYGKRRACLQTPVTLVINPINPVNENGNRKQSYF